MLGGGQDAKRDSVENRGEQQGPAPTPQIPLCHVQVTTSGTGRRHLNDWSWGAREESAFASNAFVLSASPSVIAKPVPSTVAPTSTANRSPAVGSRSQQKESVQLVSGSPLLTLLAAASLIDNSNNHAGQPGADGGEGSSAAASRAAGAAAAAGSGSKSRGASRATPSVRTQGGGANRSAKAPRHQPSSPAPASSPAVPAGRLTERQQLQMAIQESLGLPADSTGDGGSDEPDARSDLDPLGTPGKAPNSKKRRSVSSGSSRKQEAPAGDVAKSHKRLKTKPSWPKRASSDAETSTSAGYVYDKEYFKVQKSEYSGVHGRGNSWVARVKPKGKNPRQLYFADELDAAAAVDCYARENGEDPPNFGNDKPRRVLTVEEVEQKRIRHGDRFKEKPKDKLAYTFTPSSPYKGVNYHHGRWIARYSEAGKALNLGSFATQNEAAMAWDAYALTRGRTALNFPLPAAPGGSSPSKRTNSISKARTRGGEHGRSKRVSK